MNYPAASCEVSTPRLRVAMARQFGGGSLRSYMRTLEQPQLDILAMQLRITFFTALLPHILANDCFIPVTSYGTNEIPLGPKFATPQTFFDGRNTMKNLASRETFDDLNNLGGTIARH